MTRTPAPGGPRGPRAPRAAIHASLVVSGPGVHDARVILESDWPSHRVSFDDAGALAALGATTSAPALVRALGRRGHDVTVELSGRPVLRVNGPAFTLHPIGALLTLVRAPLGRIPALLGAWLTMRGREA